MDYQEVFNTYQELKGLLLNKKEAIIHKRIDELNKIDENCREIFEKIQKFDLKNTPNNFTDEQKEDLKKLGIEIRKIEENNEILIKHSLSVINNILSGILNIAQGEKCSYNSRGESYNEDESLDISSITEEA